MSLTETTPLLEKQRQDEQEALAARHNGTVEKGPKSPWVIARLRSYLQPDQVWLAERLLDLRAQSLGYVLSGDGQVIDGGENGREVANAARCDAQTTLHGYEAAVFSRIGHASARRCFWGIVSGDHYADVAHAVGYKDGRGSYRALFVRLVQLVMIAAQDYDDEINKRPPTTY